MLLPTLLVLEESLFYLCVFSFIDWQFSAHRIVDYVIPPLIRPKAEEADITFIS